MIQQIDALLGGMGVALLWQFGGHYFFVRHIYTLSHPVLTRLAAYVWGVAGLIAGASVYGWLSGDPGPALVLLVLSAASGLVTGLVYWGDDTRETKESNTDLSHEVADLRRRRDRD